MKSQHPALTKNDYYVKEGVDVEQLQKITVKEEVYKHINYCSFHQSICLFNYDTVDSSFPFI